MGEYFTIFAFLWDQMWFINHHEGQNIQEKVDKDVKEKAGNIDLRTEEIEKEEIEGSRKKRHIPSE